ncbi:MAG TPA: protein phosphatase 2C domain-containing protein [Candidatus Eisenbacteria bacterium]|nr:protein phosphatase 2C domain-containing protein [Candidatus Eisenbacteria bacterium]
MTPSRTKVEIAARSDRGKKREVNEDTYLVFRTGRFVERIQSNIPESDLGSHYEGGGYLMAVADGMGGMRAGEVASREALLEGFRLVLRAPRWLLSLDDPATRDREIEAFFERVHGYLAGMHAALLRQMAADPAKAGMGTTYTAAYSVGLDLFVVHIGDSRAYLYHDGGLRRLTRDHTLAQRLADQGAIAQAEVDRHPQRHVLTRVVGGSGGWFRAEIHHTRLQPGDMVLVCTDGLTGTVSEEEIAATLGRHSMPEEVCDALLGSSLDRGAPDNVTMIVARYREAG